MSKLSSILAWTTLILLSLVFSGLGSGTVYAAEPKAKAGINGIELAPVAVNFTLNGYRADIGGGPPDVRWVTGNLGDSWGEGEWVPYQLVMTGIPNGLVGLDSVAVSYDFMYPHGGDMYRFVDLVRGVQVGTTVLTDSQGWPGAGGSAMPTTTNAELETAQNTPNEFFWTGFTPLNLPNSQINRTLTGGLDVPPGTERHVLRINKSDLIAAGVPSNASTVVIYFQLHLARTVVWNNQLQSGYDVAPTDAWGGYLYGTDGWPTADPMVGSGYVPGSSGHVGMEYPVTGRTVGLPIPEPSAGEANGVKWHDLDGDGEMDGGEPPIPGWEIHVLGTVEGVDFSTSVLTDASGYYAFEHLTPGTIWTIKEDAQRDVPPEFGYFQTYPSVGTTVGIASGVAVGPPPADVAGVGWSVFLTENGQIQPNMNFGNGRYEIGILCPDDITIACDESADPSNTGQPTVEGQCPCAAGAVCDPVLSYDDVIVPSACPNEYTIERTWTAECEGEDISVTCVQTIIVEDDTPPYWVSACPGDVTVECDEVPEPAMMEADDTCDEDVSVSFDEQRTDGSCSDAYTLTRTWTAEDDCGNQLRCVQTITVEDTTDPEITCPPDDTFECDETIVFGTATATDNCDPDPEITFEDETIPGSCPGNYVIERTWTATDACGNTDECVQTITVRDTTDPYWTSTCPSNDTVECDDIPDPPTMTAEDACDDDVQVEYDEQRTDGSCADSYTLTRTWTATDDCGNQTVCFQTITVVDTTPPYWVTDCPVSRIIECGDSLLDLLMEAADNCDPDVEVRYGTESVPGSCAGEATVTRTYTAIDNCGNETVCEEVLTVRDTRDPYWVTECPVDATVECDQVPDPPRMEAEDRCDPDVQVEYDEQRTAGSCPDSYTLTRTWTATDDCGNDIECVQVLTVEDTTDPEITCPSDRRFECDETVDFGMATATDNCDPDPDITYDDNVIPGGNPSESVIERTWTATDACGNSDECVQTVTIVDDTDPEITCPADHTFDCGETIVFGQATATDNCDPDPEITFDDETISGSCPGNYTIERTWTATDAAGNTDECVQTITVRDITDPYWVTSCPSNDTVECDQVPDPPTMEAEDACDPHVSVEYDEQRTDGSCADSYTLTRTWTATDDCGNDIECVQVLTVEDTTDPVITCPADDTFECDETVEFGQATAADNCDPDPEITFEDETIPGSCPGNYTIERTWTATDLCGNTDECVQVITVEDTTDPYWVTECPADATVECDQVPDPPTMEAADNCDEVVEVTYEQQRVNGSCEFGFQLVRTWVAEDDCGNTARCEQTITVEDTQDPVITCPADDTFECDETIVFGQATATDNCDSDPDITYNDNTVPGSNPNEYVIERTWTATDVCGNTGQCVQRVTIVDMTPPEITCPPNDTFECDENVVFGQATATDNCDTDPDITYDDAVIPGDCPNEYMIERTWTAIDAAGNSASCLQVLEIVDTTPPAITCAPDKSAGCLDDVVFDEPSASDNCDDGQPAIRVVSTITQAGPGPCQETHTRTWEAEDACGNTSRCSQSIVQVFDETPPTLFCADDKQIACNAEVVFDQPQVLDTCDPSPVVRIVSTTMEPGPGQCEETHTRTWEAEDACGNISDQCSQTITRVVDNQSPVLTVAPDKVLPCNATVVFDPPGISDNCDPDPVVEVVSTVVSGGVEPCVEIHTRCWRGTDACGNVSGLVCQSVTVKVDEEPPVLTCAPDKSIPFGTEPIFDEPTATDNCTISGDFVEISNLVTSDPETQQEVYQQCWIVSDDCGNLSNECCQRITVEAPPEPYCTFRCWDWGADCLEDPNEPVSTTPSCIRDRYFDDLYPDGVMVGVEGVRTAVWTSSHAIEEFLCSYGIPKVLNRNYVNPKRYQLLGVLVGETLCLKLNRDFSCAGYMSGLGYPAPDACYGDYVLPEDMPKFAGLTVDEFLEVCDQVVAGNTAVLRDYGANIDHLYSAAVYVNWLFSGCNGAPTEPPLLVSGHDEDVEEPAGEPLPVKLSLSVQPNPLFGSTTMRLALPTDAEVSIVLYDIQGRQVASLVSEFEKAGFHDVAWNGKDDRGSSLASGVYFCRVQVNKRTALMEKLVKL